LSNGHLTENVFKCFSVNSNLNPNSKPNLNPNPKAQKRFRRFRENELTSFFGQVFRYLFYVH